MIFSSVWIMVEPYNLSISALHIIGHSNTENNHLELINKVKGTDITGITVVQLLQVLLVTQEPET
jgi:hypothetical protein